MFSSPPCLRRFQTPLYLFFPFSTSHSSSFLLFLSSPVEEIEQMNNLFQQKQRELVMAASKVEELNRQLELLKNGKMENFHDNQSSVAELDRLYKELQVCRNKNATPKQIVARKTIFVLKMLNHFLSLYLYLVLHGGQLRNKLNQDQNSKLQQQRENLNKRNLEVASMDKRISELRDRLWKKKAALQQKENLPVSIVLLQQHRTFT